MIAGDAYHLVNPIRNVGLCGPFTGQNFINFISAASGRLRYIGPKSSFGCVLALAWTVTMIETRRKNG